MSRPRAPESGASRRPSTTTKGRQAEDLAAACLEKAGLAIVVRNWRRPEAELDLVAKASDGTLVFVEVRSRTGELFGHPLESVGRTKRRRVVSAARLYLTEAPPAAGYRFDVVSILFDPAGEREPEVMHLAEAFDLDDL